MKTCVQDDSVTKRKKEITVFFGHHSVVILPWLRLKYMFFFSQYFRAS